MFQKPLFRKNAVAINRPRRYHLQPGHIESRFRQRMDAQYTEGYRSSVELRSISTTRPGAGSCWHVDRTKQTARPNVLLFSLELRLVRLGEPEVVDRPGFMVEFAFLDYWNDAAFTQRTGEFLIERFVAKADHARFIH
jgi:hypothetical protein